MTQLLSTRANVFFATGEDGKSLLPHAEIIIIGLEREYQVTLGGTRREDKLVTSRFTVNIHSIDDLINDLQSCKTLMEKDLKAVVGNILTIGEEGK